MKNGDKPAFAVLHSIDGNWVKEPLEKYQGLTKREYFAAMALQGLLSSGTGVIDEDGNIAYKPENIAYSALMYADELLKQLES